MRLQGTIFGQGRPPWVLTHMAKHKKADSSYDRQPLLTTNEMMAMLRLNRATLCRYCRSGKIPHIRMPDASYRFNPTAIEEWLTERTVGL